MERRYDIDWLRVTAIGLLIIYHIAIVFQPWAMFIAFIRSNELLEVLWKPMTFLNIWRIPILFYISGMGLYFSLRKRNWKQLILERSKRILLPFLFGIVAITPLHMFIFQKYYNMPLNYYPHMGHLWFLGNIFIYVLLLLPLFIYLKNNRSLKKRITKIMTTPFAPLLIIVFFILEAYIIKPQFYALYSQTWHGFYLGLLAFFFGFMIMYVGKNFWDTLTKFRNLYLIFGVTLFLIRFLIFNTEAPGYLMAIESNFWIFAIFGFYRKFLNKPSSKLTYLSTAAYPIYIIHMFALYLSSLIILPLTLPPLLKFITITVFTFMLCFGIYEMIIKRVNFLRPLFGLNFKSNKLTNRIHLLYEKK